MNQIEVHPYNPSSALLDFCGLMGIAVMGYSPLGSAQQKHPEAHGCTLLRHPAVEAIAAEVSAGGAARSAAQVLIRWGLQRCDGGSGY